MSEEEVKNAEQVDESKPEAAPAAEVKEKKEETPKAPKEEKKPKVAEESEKVEVPAKFKKIVEEIEKMSVLDLNELVKLFEKKFGVSASAVAVAADGGGGDSDDSGGMVSITLEDAGASKIQVIKVVKELLGLGLKDAKDFVDAAPKVLKEGVTKEEAEEIKGKIGESGAKVSVK